MKMSPKLAAIISSILFASVLGVLIAVASFGVLRILEQLGEGLGLVPARFGENNPELMMAASVVAAIPVLLWFMVWFFKKALISETALENYEYKEPETPKNTGKK